jgi:hypothetical protein
MFAGKTCNSLPVRQFQILTFPSQPTETNFVVSINAIILTDLG